MTEIDRIVLVYQLKKKPYISKCVYFENDKHAMDEKYTHVATLDPARWIETLLNSKDKNKLIEELYD